MAKKGVGQGKRFPARQQRLAAMDEEILDIAGAARLVGVSTRTIYNLARNGTSPQYPDELDRRQCPVPRM